MIFPTIRAGTVAEMREYGEELLQAHRDDEATPEGGIIDPNWDTYLALEQTGMLVGLLAWLVGDLVGYAAGIVYQDLHNKGLKVLEVTQIYVYPQHRGITGLRLVRAIEFESSKRECDLVRWNAVTDTALMELLIIRGYGQESSAFSKSFPVSKE
jgi:Acetyltransferase (GNAT) family